MSINWKHVAVFAAAGAALAMVSNLWLKPDTIDYANVALVPELAEELGADLPTRLQLARLGRRALGSAKGMPGVKLPAGEFADKSGRASLERSGQKSLDLLSVEQRKRFYKMFKARDIVPVTYRTQPSGSGKAASQFTVTFGWKDSGSSLSNSLRETEGRLRDAWQWIPSQSVAVSLLDHESDAVNSAATKWLQKNSREHRRIKSRALQRLSEKARSSN